MKKHLTQFNTPDWFNDASNERAYDVPNVSVIKSTKEVKYNKEYPAPHGVSILMKDGKFYTKDEFVEKGFTESSAIGVYINDTYSNPKRHLLMCWYLSDVAQWAPDNDMVPGVSCSTELENGYPNTIALFKQYPDHPIRDFVYNAFNHPDIIGYIPSFKELAFIEENISDVNEALEVLGYEAIDISIPYLTSTQNNDDAETFITAIGGSAVPELKSNENPAIVVGKLDDEDLYQE